MNTWHKERPQRVAQIVVSGAALLATVFLGPPAKAEFDARSQRNSAVNLEVRELYNFALKPCLGTPYEVAGDDIRVKSGEIGIDVFIALSHPYGLRVSPTGVRPYLGDLSYLYPPAPPPTNGVPASKNSVDLLHDDLAPSPEIALAPRLAKQVFDVLHREIITAGPTPYFGMADGVGYRFFHGTECAYTWSPPYGSRAARLTELADELVSLSRAPPNRRRAVQSKIRAIIVALEQDRARFGA